MLLSGDAYSALDYVGGYVEASGENDRPSTLVICGDLFDSNKPSSLDLLHVTRLLEKFETVFFITGNHDCVQPPWLLSLKSMEYTDIIELNMELFPLEPASDKAFISGVNWTQSREELLERMRNIAERARELQKTGRLSRLYLVLHSSFRHLLGFDGAYQLEASDIAEIFDGIKVNVIVGDIHTRDTLHVNENLVIHSPGSLYPLSRDKMTDSCSVSEVDIATGEIDDICTDTREYHSITVGSQAELETTVAGIVEDNDQMLPPYVCVTPADASVVLHRPQNINAAVQIMSVVSADVSSVVETTSENVTMEQAVRQECSDPDVEDMAVSLLTCEDVLKETEEWLKTWKVERL